MDEACNAGLQTGGRGAYSLLEMMIVVMVIGIITAITVPIIISASRENAMRQAVSELDRQMELARNIAMRDNTRTRVVFGVADSSYKVEAWDVGAGVWVQEGDDHALPDSVSFSSDGDDPITFPSDTVTFNARGSVLGANGTVYMGDTKGNRMRIHVLLSTGRIDVLDGWS
jgi:prepilin-type N-terminal cleavage/methylation domain-containing protein